MNIPASIKFAFFGTSHIAVYVLNELVRVGLVPALAVTTPAKPQGRKMEIVETAVARRARELQIPVADDWQQFAAEAWDVAVVVDYGKILPKRLLEIPRRGFLNVHPSLLPRFRGPSPIRSAILNDERHTGVTIMLLDEQMDHGPVVAQKRIDLATWPPRNSELEKVLLQEGGRLLADMLPKWTRGELEARPQNDDVATYCEKLTKEDGRLNFGDDAYRNLLKIRALEGWPGTHAFFERGGKKLRVRILDAHLDAGVLIIDYVKPEGKGVMSYDDFLRSGAQTIS